MIRSWRSKRQRTHEQELAERRAQDLSALPVRAAGAARGIAKKSVEATRETVHEQLLERAKAQEALSDDQIWRRYQVRHLVLFVTIPAVLVGTAGIATAYGTGLMSHEAPAPKCQPVKVPAPPAGSFSIVVMNASGQNGAATDVGRDLTRRGFKVTSMETAPRSLYVKAPVKIFHGKNGLDQALLAAQTIAGAELAYDGRKGTDISFVLGADFTKMLPAPPPKPPKLNEFTVNVYNATWKPGLATDTLAELKKRGFKVGKSGNDPDKSFLPKDTAVIRYGQDADLAAKLVAKHFPGARLDQVSRDNMTIDVVLGNNFETLVPVADVPKPPPVRKDPPTVMRPCD